MDRGVFVTVCSVGLGSRLQQHDCDQKCELSNWVILLNVVTTRSAPCPRSGGIRWRARSGGSRRIPIRIANQPEIPVITLQAGETER